MDIAIVRRNGLGDLLCAYPLVLYLQKTYPASSITLFVDERNAPLLPYLPPVDDVVVFPAKGNKYWKFYKTSRPYKKKFDLAISAKTSPMKLNNLFLYWLKAKERVAYVDSSWHSKYINRPIFFNPLEAQQMHQALKGLKTVAPHLTEVPEEFYPTVRVPDSMKERYGHPRRDQLPVVIVTATTTKAASRLNEARYASLLNRLHAIHPISVRVIGQDQDRERAAGIVSRLSMDAEVYFPRNFDEFMVLLEDSDYYFVGDGGVAHIGAALGKKGVALYGATNPIEWRPLSKQMVTFFDPVHVDYLSDETIFEALKGMRYV